MATVLGSEETFSDSFHICTSRAEGEKETEGSNLRKADHFGRELATCSLALGRRSDCFSRGGRRFSVLLSLNTPVECFK